MMYHVSSPAFTCAYQSVCLCSNNVSRKKRMWEVNPPNGWSGLHLYRMLLCSYFLNSSFALPCPCFFSVLSPSQYLQYNLFFPCSYQPLPQTSPRTCWRRRLWPDRVAMFWLNASPGCLLEVLFLGGRGRKPWERATGTERFFVEQ